MDDEDELFRRFRDEFAAISADMASQPFELSPLEAWTVLSNIQQALRHEANVGPPAEVARGVAQRLEAMFASQAALAEVARRGWNPEYDE